MFLSYNGVKLELLTLDRVDRTLVYTPDETTLLYVEWGIACSCVYAPTIEDQEFLGGTSIDPQASDADEDLRDPTAAGQDPDYDDVDQPGDTNALMTDRELRLRLAVPRKYLRIWGYNQVGAEATWLETPRGKEGQRYPGDAKNGPIVRAMPVVANVGAGQVMGVQLEIKTWLTPCSDGSDRLVLAHRWQMTHDHDENYYLARTVTGEIHFNGGLKDLFKQRPDLVVKQQMFHPIPLGFRRTLGPIVRSSDGLVIRYAYSDVDQEVVFDPGQTGATQMEIVETVQYVSPGWHGWFGGGEKAPGPGRDNKHVDEDGGAFQPNFAS